MSDIDHKSISKVQHEANYRRISTVPFVEIKGGRLQGVVSSKSSSDRIYVSFIEAGTLNYYCSTNNNRVCGGLRGGPCKHLKELIKEACTQYGAQKVAKGLRLDADPTTIHNPYDIERHITGSKQKEEAGVVFSRFLTYLKYVEFEDTAEPMPEMAWFVVG